MGGGGGSLCGSLGSGRGRVICSNCLEEEVAWKDIAYTMGPGKEIEELSATQKASINGSSET